MTITDEQRRLCAELEAELRSGDTEWLKHDLWKLTATPPDTATGREWWAEALTIESLWTRESKQWSGEVGWEDRGYVKFDRSRSEAITRAIVAAAEAWEKAK